MLEMPGSMRATSSRRCHRRCHWIPSPRRWPTSPSRWHLYWCVWRATTTITIIGAQQIQAEGEKLQQIEQPMDIAMTSAGKMLTRQVSAAVRLQAATRGLLARRRVREMRDLQLIQPCTPS